MIRFLKDVYLTGFTLIIRLSRGKSIGYKVGGACGILTVIETISLVNIFFWIDILAGKKVVPDFSGPEFWFGMILILFTNMYVLFIRRYGILFERQFDHLEKSRKTLLKASCAVLLLAAIIFSVYTTRAYHRFLKINRTTFNNIRLTLPHA